MLFCLVCPALFPVLFHLGALENWNVHGTIVEHHCRDFFLFCRYVTKLFSLRESNNWSAEKLCNLRALAYGVYEDRLDLYLQRLFLYVCRSLERKLASGV